jgi:hypothetical protein
MTYLYRIEADVIEQNSKKFYAMIIEVPILFDKRNPNNVQTYSY